MPEQEFPVMKRTLSPFMEVITQKDSHRHKDAICGNVSLDLEGIIFLKDSDEKYLNLPYLELIAFGNLGTINELERNGLRTDIESLCDRSGVDFNSLYYSDMNRDMIEGNILRSGDLYLAEGSFGGLSPHLIFMVPENSKVRQENRRFYIDDSITDIESHFRRIKDKYLDNITEIFETDQKNNFFTLDNNFERVEYTGFEDFTHVTISNLEYDRKMGYDDMTMLKFEKIGHVKDIPMLSLNNYNPPISVDGCSYALGPAALPRIMFTKP